MNPYSSKAFSLLITVLVGIQLCSCGKLDQLFPNKEIALEEGKLHVSARFDPSIYYVDRNGQSGFEFELIKAFAEKHNWELEISSHYNVGDTINAVKEKTSHIALSGIAKPIKKDGKLLFSDSYLSSQQLVLYHLRTPQPNTIKDILNSRVAVIADTHHEAYLNQATLELPSLNWYATADEETINLFNQLDNDKLDYIIVDKETYLHYRAHFPFINTAFTLAAPAKRVWITNNSRQGKKIIRLLNKYIEEITDNGQLALMQERFFSHQQQSSMDHLTFAKAVKKQLPKYEALIKKIADKYNMDWHLLAAISYQESYWNPRAKSPTGVRGMMMLTQRTAREMGVSNRLNAEQSLDGGARYFLDLYRRLPEQVTEPDRTWLALAAYNVGMGHIYGARKITKMRGGNRDHWSDLKENLPLLRQKKWYKKTRYGYARGDEPVIYVENIRQYVDYLNWNELNKKRLKPPTRVDQYIPPTADIPFKTLN